MSAIIRAVLRLARVRRGARSGNERGIEKVTEYTGRREAIEGIKEGMGS